VHAGSFFGQRSPRAFLTALHRLLAARPDLRGRVEARFLGAFRPSDAAFAEELQLGDALRVEGFRPHAEALRAMKDADVLLLLIPRAGGRGLSILSGKVYEYLAAERPVLALVPPEGAAANLLAQTASGWVADPDDEDAITAALGRAVDEWEAGRLEERRLPDAWRERLDRRARAAELAVLMRG
jgi:glycosyltransferase involved in cell wall biosynthesis